MIWFIPILLALPAIQWIIGSLTGVILVTFFLKQVIQIAMMIVAGLIAIYYIKNKQNFKGYSNLIPIFLIIGLLISPLILNNVMSLVGAQYTPLTPYQFAVPTGEISSSGTPIERPVTIDISMIIAVFVTAFMSVNKQARGALKKYLG